MRKNSVISIISTVLFMFLVNSTIFVANAECGEKEKFTPPIWEIAVGMTATIGTHYYTYGGLVNERFLIAQTSVQANGNAFSTGMVHFPVSDSERVYFMGVPCELLFQVVSVDKWKIVIQILYSK